MALSVAELQLETADYLPARELMSRCNRKRKHRKYGGGGNETNIAVVDQSQSNSTGDNTAGDGNFLVLQNSGLNVQTNISAGNTGTATASS